MRTPPTRLAYAGLAALFVLGAVACGDDDDDGGGGATSAVGTADAPATSGATATTPAGTGTAVASTAGEGTGTTTAATGTAGGGDEVTAAQAVIDPFLQPATSLNIDVPLDSAPEEGIQVGWLEANFEGVTVITPGFQEAVEALGWELVTISYDVNDPATANSAMQQAVDQGVDYIAISGLPTATYDAALTNAKAAGIPLVMMDAANEPDAADKGVLTCIACDSMVSNWGRLLGNWIIADSGGQANSVYFTIPEFSSLIPEGESFKQTMADGCAACSTDELASTIQSFSGGGLSGEIISYLQTHPDVNYVYFAFSQMASGARDAMDSAGIGEDVKIVLPAHELSGIQGIVDGKHQAGVTLPVQGHAWFAVDAMARDSLGMDITPIEEALMPMEIWTPDNVPTPTALWNGPEGYQDMFKELWQVS